MKHLFAPRVFAPRVRSISTVLCALLLTNARADAPLAMLADVAGNVQIVRGGKALGAKSGAKLLAGDRVVSRGGKATIYYLGRAPQKLSAGASATIGAAKAGKGSGVWNGVYSGVSGGFAARPRVAATVRGDEQVVLVAPVKSLVVSRPRFVWQRNKAASDYEIVVLESDSKVEVWRATTTQTALELPTGAKALRAGVIYGWSVTPRRDGRALEPISSWFSIATPAANATLQSGLKELASLPDSEMRRTTQAAWAASRGFRALALQTLGISETTNFATLAETPRAVLRSILTDEQQAALLDKDVKKPIIVAASTVVLPDAGLPMDGFYNSVPASARKRFGDKEGLFSIEIPHSWGGYRRVIDDMTLTELGPSYGGEMSISVVVAPLATAPNRATERVVKIVREAGTAVETSPTKTVTLKLTNGTSVPMRETRMNWREEKEETTRDWRGAIWEFALGGKTYLLGWSAVHKSTVEFDRTSALLQNLLPSFSATTNQKTGITERESDAIHAEMKQTLTMLIALNDRRGTSDGKISASTDTEALRKTYEAAPRNSIQRAEAARDLARATENAAWTRWNQTEDENSRREARELWQRADALRLEGYESEVQALTNEIAATDARLAELRAQTPYLPFAQSHGFIIDSWLNLQALRAFHIQTIAFDRRERDVQEKWARREFDYRRAKLELAAIAPGNDEEALSRRAEIASSLESIGDVLQGRADYAASEAHYRRAIAWREALPETYPNRGLEGPWRNLGSLAINSGDFIQAREHYQVSLREIDRIAPIEDAALARRNNPELTALRRSVRAQGRATISNNLGYIAQGLGDYALSREHYQRAYQQTEELTDDGLTGRMKKSLRARSLNNLATVAADGGDLDTALKHQDAALVYLRELSDENGLALWMMNRAAFLELRGDGNGARRAAADARTRFLALRSPKNAAFSNAFMSRLARQEGDGATALSLAREAIQLARTSKDVDAIISATRALAAAIMVSPAPDWREFDLLIDESFAQSQRIAAPLAQSGSLDIRAQSKQMRGDLAGAEADYRAAIARLEAVRATAPSSESFSDQHSNIYERLVRLLLQQNRTDEAFDVLQRARSSALRENLRLSSLKSPDPVLQKLLDRATALESKLRTLRAARETVLAAPTPDKAAVENLEGLIASTQSEFFSVSARLKKANPAFDRALTISPLELKKASTSFPAGTVLVQYALLEDELYIFVVSRERLKIYQPKVRSNSVLEAARRFRALMDTAQSDARAGKTLATPETDVALRASLTELHTMLIAPIAGELSGQKMLAFVPSGALYYVPLHALARQTAQGLRFLIEDIPVAYLAAGDVLSVVQARDDDRFGAGALALGDPTGADLPEARKEARAVAQILPASQSLVGDAAQKSVLLDSKNLNRRVLHLAMHGVLNSALPDDSYIQLAGSGEDSRLRVGEIVGLDLNRVDLVTLSACQTALGERAPSGGEISSLAQSFSSAGAPSVIASLWSVEDDSTRQLMETFYRSYASGGDKAVSLQRAQIGLLKQPATRHPFFWAPFELLGDWR